MAALRLQVFRRGPKLFHLCLLIAARGQAGEAHALTRLIAEQVALPYFEIGLLHDEGKATGVFWLTPVSSISTPKSPSNLRGSNAPL